MTALYALRTAEQPLPPPGGDGAAAAELVVLNAINGWQVVGIANVVVPHGEVTALVVQDPMGRRRAVYWDRMTRPPRGAMVAPLVDLIHTAPGGPVEWSAGAVPPPPPWYAP